MAKRTATSELNRDNWDDEDAPEDAGTFAKAAEDVLERRVIKAARRRLPPSDNATKSAFGSFSGFKTTTTTSASPFSFLANVSTNSTSSLNTNTNQSKNAASNGAPKASENGAQNAESSSTKPQSSSNISTVEKDSTKQDEKIFKKSSDYYAKLKGLNESVAQWIKTHVDANPFCILSPIFGDYERYLKDIESQHGSESEKAASVKENTQVTSSKDNVKETPNTDKKAENSSFASTAKSSTTLDWKSEKSIFSNLSPSTNSMFGNKESTTEAPKSIFGNIDKTTEGKSVFGNLSSEQNPFLSKPSTTADDKSSEGAAASDTKSSTGISFPQTTTATFSFGQSFSSSTASAGFSFGSGKPFSFGAQAVKPQGTEEKTESEEKDEDDEPPKPDFKPVTEEGAIYEQRCKVFVKKDGNFSDKGVGTLFLKPTPNGKTQLIVRADTSLGNLLLNTLLTESIPTKRMNKNTVMMVCLPMPDSQPPPTPVLLRVKTSEDADLLFETLDKHKK